MRAEDPRRYLGLASGIRAVLSGLEVCDADDERRGGEGRDVVLEVPIVRGEKTQLEVLGGLVLGVLAIDHHTQAQIPGRDGEHVLEAGTPRIAMSTRRIRASIKLVSDATAENLSLGFAAGLEVRVTRWVVTQRSGGRSGDFRVFGDAHCLSKQLPLPIAARVHKGTQMGEKTTPTKISVVVASRFSYPRACMHDLSMW